ncbi:MAG: carboxypeptidase-like regulatory domain-containing protein [Acidobacteria bacterium]|nr:carboxypeptidase-like regulatory domain-containing protein [Acidobacteriota bacterium]
MAIISGTVFREPGFALPGVEILLQPDAGPTPSVKVKKMKAVSDSRGEFSFRVPAVPMRYTLSFQAAGHRPEQKSVTVSGEERQDVFVTLKPAAKEGSQ